MREYEHYKEATQRDEEGHGGVAKVRYPCHKQETATAYRGHHEQ